MRTVLIVLAIFIAIWWTTVNLTKFLRGHPIPALNFVFMAASITAVVTYFMGIW